MAPETRNAPARHELDGTVVNIELTLISITQGIALYFLIESSYGAIVERRLLLWPYVATGLIVILLFWARAIMHTLTVIRWPLELGHNFLYIGATFLEGVMFTQIENPVAWHVMGACYGAAIWLLFGLDLGMMRERAREQDGPGSRALFEILLRDQLMNLRAAMPIATGFYLAAAALVLVWPSRLGALALGFLQLAAAAGYLVYVVRLLRRIAPRILQHRAERAA